MGKVTTVIGFVLLNSEANALRDSTDRPTRITFCWRCASSRAKAIPKPREAPVTRANASCFISVVTQGTAHRLRESRIKHAVPERCGDPIPFIDSPRTVMVEVVFFYASEKRQP